MSSDSMNDENLLLCTLPSPELAPRRAEIQRLIEQAGSVVSKPDGVSFSFRNTVEIAHALVDFIRFEQQCCSSITYELRSEPPHMELTLRLRAPSVLVASVQKFYLINEISNNNGIA